MWRLSENFNGVREAWKTEAQEGMLPSVPKVVEFVKGMGSVRRVEVEVDVRGESGLTLYGGSLAGKDCLNWLLPLLGVERDGVVIEIGFGTSGRCSTLYQKRWDMVLEEHRKR